MKLQIRVTPIGSLSRAGAGLLLAAAIWALALFALGAVEGTLQTPASPTQRKPTPAQIENPSVEVPNEVVIDSTTVGKRMPPKAGDICMVCNRPVHDDDVVFLVRGQRMAIHRGELDRNLRGQLERLVAQLEPRGAFIGAEHNQPALSSVWFLVGLYVLAGLVFAGLSAHRALHAGHSAMAWFALGLVFNAFGYLFLLTRPKRKVQAPAGVPGGLRKIAATYAPQPCPGCGSLNHPSAASCLSCGARLEPKVVSEVARAGMHPA